MKFSGEHRIAARQQRVWNALSDPAVLRACIAGCERIDKLSDSEMVATVTVAVGPMSATFKGDVSLSSISAPLVYTLTAPDGAAALAKVRADVSLSEEHGQTLLKYVATAEMGDPLASVGGWVAQTVASINADEFFAAFARHLSALHPGEPAAPALGDPAAFVPRHLPAAPARTPARSILSVPIRAWVLATAVAIAFVLGYGFARLP